MSDLGVRFLDEITRALRGHKRLADAAIAQLSDAQLFAQLDSEANSVAILIRHMAGNMRSRFTDFLTTDGEKPNRFRDGEFETPSGTSRAALLESWESGWRVLLDAVAALTPDDLDKTITIRGEAHSVLQTLNRAQLHYAQHTGQIVLLAKHYCGPAWKTLSIAKGRSEEFKTRQAGRLGMPQEK